jgi:pyruvate/2-oxoglutarate dehydrogenase complex dihydrolipoamide acyltransferase (E2) component
MSRIREERGYCNRRQSDAFEAARQAGAKHEDAVAIGEAVWYHYRALFRAYRDTEKAAAKAVRDAEKAAARAERGAERAAAKAARPPRTPEDLAAMNRERVRRHRARQAGA